MLVVVAILIFFIGVVHSVLGEKYILVRLFRRDNIPKLYGSDWFTKRTLRFAWHITTIAWWGMSALVLAIYLGVENIERAVLIILSVVFGVSGAVSAIFSKLKHFSWFVFLAIAGLCAFAV